LFSIMFRLTFLCNCSNAGACCQDGCIANSMHVHVHVVWCGVYQHIMECGRQVERRHQLDRVSVTAPQAVACTQLWPKPTPELLPHPALSCTPA
jgi:hypothetical protein